VWQVLQLEATPPKAAVAAASSFAFAAAANSPALLAALVDHSSASAMWCSLKNAAPAVMLLWMVIAAASASGPVLPPFFKAPMDFCVAFIAVASSASVTANKVNAAKKPVASRIRERLVMRERVSLPRAIRNRDMIASV